MTSRLFNAVVGFGIALGSMSLAACDASGEPETASTEAAQSVDSDTATPPAPPADPFCEVNAWPTTKCSPMPIQAQACTDPTNACGDYPGNLCRNRNDCFHTTEAGACDTSRSSVWMICSAAEKSSASPGWECPSGTVPRAQCTAFAGASP